jgi:GDP-L-galactose phosphorylase
VFGFVAQLNEGRATKKRATEFRMDQVVQAYDDAKFNFTKAQIREVLLTFEPSPDSTSRLLDRYLCVCLCMGACLLVCGRVCVYACAPALMFSPLPLHSAPASSSPNLILINVSPIEYGHVLLVPRVLDCLQQLVDPSTAALALHFAREAANPYFRVGYNSLGAYATINHLHFQVCLWCCTARGVVSFNVCVRGGGGRRPHLPPGD